MNERIRELAEQAEKYALDNVGKGHYGIEDLIYQFQFADTTMAKFAELIVRECAEQIKTQGISASSEDYGDYEIGFNAGVYHALYTIKQHFGVEE